MSDVRTSHVWHEYFDRFDYLTLDALREGNHPRILEHAAPVDKAIVLIHGLTDCPYVMSAIGEYFHEQLRYNVYMPLLHGHGLRDIESMEGTSLAMWKENAAFAVEVARLKAGHVSIGGLSTGGALSLYTAANDEGVTGDLYLFSAALDLAGGLWGIAGELKEWVLRTSIVKLMDSFKEPGPLIGRNPYRYIRMDNDGAIELSKLIKETDEIIASHHISKNPFPLRVFAAHSDSDVRVDFEGVERLQQVTPADRFSLFRIPAEQQVPHASIVLKDPIFAIDPTHAEPPLEIANPTFDAMMNAIAEMH